MISTDLTCVTTFDGTEIDCVDILNEDAPICDCGNCVRELQFEYTGLPCSPELSASGRCSDQSPNPFIAGYRVLSCDGTDQVFTSGIVEQGDFVTIGTLDGICLPSCIGVEISVPGGTVTQSFELDSACNGARGLILSSDYGAFESIGYSCSATDTHNCFQELTYDLSVCNQGVDPEAIYDWSLMLNGADIDLLETKPTAIASGACFTGSTTEFVDRCNAFESSAEVTANSTNPLTGLPPGCWDTEGLGFGWDQPETAAPTPSPT